MLARAMDAGDCELTAPDEPTHYHCGTKSILHVALIRNGKVLDVSVLADMDTNHILVKIKIAT